ncbi:MAG: serine/threonine-protein kinase [Kofleriaceae bacterium]
MTPDRWREVQAAFDAVVEVPLERRPHRLDEICGDDPSLRAEVMALLAADDDSSLLDHAPGQLLGTIAATIECGDRIGAYRVVRALGAGGMGEVFLAERADGVFEQRVAIKVVRAPVTAAHVQARFALERTIVARLDHPGVARILDGGTTSTGRPYFVMEYVAGLRIDDHAERNRLSVRARVALVAAACAAVEAAHRAHIIHRDIKPDNVLVTADGNVKLLDFGIAKVIDPTDATVERTDPRQRMLSPQYAAPEQLRGDDPTPAMDVHALGVLLYQLVTGRLPYDLRGIAPTRLAHAVETAIIAPPAVDEELDAICLRALARDRRERFADAAALRVALDDYARDVPRQPARSRWRRGLAVGIGVAIAIAIAAVIAIVVAMREQERTRAVARDLATELVRAGDELAAHGDRAGAERLYRRAIDTDDGGADARAALAALLIDARRLYEAKRLIRDLETLGDPRAKALAHRISALSIP